VTRQKKVEGGGNWLEGATDPGRQALRQALDEAQPQPDPALARHRIWHRAQAPWATPAPRSWRGPVLLGAGAVVGVAAAVAIFVAVRPRAPIAQQAEQPAPVAGELTTGALERAGHRLPRGVDAELAPRSALAAGDEHDPPEVRAGRVRFSVPHQSPGQRYVVRAGAYQVAVLGTVFEVAVDGAAVSVAVESGVVAVEEAASGRRLERLTAGRTWSSVAPAPAEPTPPAGSSPPRHVSPQHSRPPRHLAVRIPEPTDPVAAGALDEARQARRADPTRALALYERLASARGPLAEVALYEMGSIENESFHDPRRALGTWQRYRERYPKGLLRAEADFSIIEVLIELREETRALDEARAFLRHHPDNERRGEVALVAADLARTGGDCGLAIDLYETATRGQLSPAQTDDAAFNRAACLAALRDPLAPRAAREYLTRFPSGRHRPDATRLLGTPTVSPGGP
jgi:hypothetical protein